MLPAAAIGFALSLALLSAPAPAAQSSDAGQGPRAQGAIAQPVSDRALQLAGGAGQSLGDAAAGQAAGTERGAAAGRQPRIEVGAQDREQAPTPEPSAPASRTITVDGVTVGYVDSAGSATAPASGAGLWKGSDSTTDGALGYFIGHNPGDFGMVARAGVGSRVTVVDGSGGSRSYSVVDAFTVPRETTWGEISERVSGRGESVALQTCVDAGYKVLVAV